MQFNHDNMAGIYLSVDLVNLQHHNRWTSENVAAALAEHEIRPSEMSFVGLAELGAWVHHLRAAFTPTNVDERCAAINELLAQGAGRLYLTTHGGRRPHLHFTAEDENGNEDVLSRIQAVTAGGLALFAVEAGGQRLGCCPSRGCGTAYVDTSRNGTRRYCTARCGNTTAVQRHRQMQ